MVMYLMGMPFVLKLPLLDPAFWLRLISTNVMQILCNMQIVGDKNLHPYITLYLEKYARSKERIPITLVDFAFNKTN